MWVKDGGRRRGCGGEKGGVRKMYNSVKSNKVYKKSLNINGLNYLKGNILTERMQKQDPSIQEIHANLKDRHYPRIKGWKKLFQVNGPKKQGVGAISISNEIDFKSKFIKRDGEGWYIFIE